VANLKKAKIPVSDIQLVDAENRYVLRYRVVSEDKNRISHWSQFLRVDGPPIDPAGYEGAIAVTIKDISVNWYDTPRRGSYDVFVRYGNGPSIQNITWGAYAYSGSSLTQSYTILNNVSAGYIGVLVQVSGNKVLNNALKIYEDLSTLKAEIDGGNANGV
jgi:hypothetical protein